MRSEIRDRILKRTENAAKQALQKIVSIVKMNPEFIALTNRITERRVTEWIRIQNQIHDRQMEAASSASRTQDKVRNMWSEYIHDVDSVSNPNTGKNILIDNRYDHAWINGDDEVIYHNSGSLTFDPNTNPNFNNVEWKQLR